MKRWMGIGIVAVTLLTLAGCGSNSASDKSSHSSENSSTSAKKSSHHKKTTKQSSSSSSSSTSSSTATSQSSSSTSASSASSTDTATHPGIPAALIGKYQETVKSDAEGFAPIYEFTPTTATYSASNMPVVVLNNVSYQMIDGNYIISGTGEPSGFYKGGPETWTIKQEGNKIMQIGSSANWAYKQ